MTAFESFYCRSYCKEGCFPDTFDMFQEKLSGSPLTIGRGIHKGFDA
jgi:hypothetical protein